MFAIIVNRQNRQEHQDRAGQRVQEKLYRGVEAALAAPDADQEIHRHEHYFPENVEEDEVEGHENAEHAGLQQEKQDVIFFFAFFDCGPGRENRERAEDGGEHD